MTHFELRLTVRPTLDRGTLIVKARDETLSGDPSVFSSVGKFGPALV